MTTPDLTPDPHPATVTVNGAGLLAYSERAKAGECHIYRMLWKDNAKYVLSLTGLEGRKLYTHDQKPDLGGTTAEKPTAQPQGMASIVAAAGASPRQEPAAAPRLTPLRGRSQQQAVQQGLGLFGK